MTAISCTITNDRATVVLRPCWIARLFGARRVTCKLVRRDTGAWHHEASGYAVTQWRWDREIMTALDFHRVEELPRVVVRAAPDHSRLQDVSLPVTPVA